MRPKAITAALDRFGAVASALCAVHCVAVGFAAAALPAIGLTVLADPRTEVAFIAAAIALGLAAATAGYRRHRKAWPLAMLIGGFALIAGSLASHAQANFGHDPDCLHRDPFGSALAVFGGLALIAFHAVNHRLGARACPCPMCAPCEPSAPASDTAVVP